MEKIVTPKQLMDTVEVLARESKEQAMAYYDQRDKHVAALKHIQMLEEREAAREREAEEAKLSFVDSPGWIGVDLDGTLAHYEGWQGADHIGQPIPAMMDRVRGWLAAGQVVKIFTARAAVPEQIPPVKRWLEANGLPDLDVTNVKDFSMVELWDDRCYRVRTNTGEALP